MTFSISFSQKPSKNVDTVVIAVYQGSKLTESAKYIDAEYNKVVTNGLKANTSFEGKNGQILTLSLNDFEA